MISMPCSTLDSLIFTVCSSTRDQHTVECTHPAAVTRRKYNQSCFYSLEHTHHLAWQLSQHRSEQQCYHPQPPPQPHCAPPHLRHLLSLSPSVPVLQWTLWSRITTHQPRLHIDVHTVLFRKLTISHFAPCLATSYFPPWVACSSACYWHTIFASGLRWVCEPRKVSLHPRAVFWEDEGRGYFWL